MRLYLVRHATAEVTACSDYERELVAKGIEQSQRVGEFCRAHGLKPETVLTSSYPRAKQTAQTIADVLGGLEVTDVSWLAAGASPQEVLSEIEGYARLDEVMLVGHEPDFSTFIAHLLGVTSARAVKVKKASLTVIDVHSYSEGGGELQMLLPVKFAS